MESITLKPHKLKGAINVPTSKSLAHRAIICASLAKGESIIKNVSMSKDIRATIEAMKSLGTNINEEGNTLYINGENTFSKKDCFIDANESGSTLRFMVPVSIINENKVHFVGRGKLGERPLDIYYDIFDKQNITYSYKEKELDLHIDGSLKPGEFIIPGNISSQFITGLLFSLPLLKEDSKIIIDGFLESSSYIDLTLQVLEIFGIEIINNEYKEFIIKGNQQYHSATYEVEADFSQAAFYLVAGAIGNEVELTNLNLESKQGDKVIIDILESMGAMLVRLENGYKMIASTLSATTIDASNCPDIIPVASIACALANGTSHIVNAKRLRIKECDRLDATVKVLKQNGIDVIEEEDSMTITGNNFFSGGHVSSFNDHRMAMMEAILATRAKNDVIIDDKNCVSKSYPHFFEDYKMLEVEDEC